MSLSHQETKLSQIIAINRVDRWSVYQRLQQLEISCQCLTNESLRAEFKSPLDAIQLWSVVKQIYSTRTELILWLNRCWERKNDGKE
ncbi:MAG: hypothetical protein QNJ54_35705 [Prochloraceae cyanobacterium]|nr:hypothetical protein [Prochloraceae cyanobacterium]